MSENNLFTDLFKYRPRPNRNPLEDFITECLGYLLKTDESLLLQYLNDILANTNPKENLRVHTQYFISSVGRIDLAIFWRENGVPKSLFVEHKISSSPWVNEDQSGNIETQVDRYCSYQENAENLNDFVLLVTQLFLQGYDKENIKWKSYLGNKTWKDIALILKRYQNLSTESDNLNKRLLDEFLTFMRRNHMVGFENFSLADLSSIVSHSNYSQKISNLSQCIIDNFKHLENFYVNFHLKCGNLGGAGNVMGHYGIVFYDEDKVPMNSPFWIVFGLSTMSPGPEESWYPDLVLAEDNIPDLECMIMMDFNNDNELQEFYKNLEMFGFEQWNNKNGGNFEVIIVRPETLVIVTRKPLVHFFTYKDQESAIINFLNKAQESITNDETGLKKIIKAYMEK